MKVTEDNLTPGDGDWRARLVHDHTGIGRVLDSVRRAAVIGIKPEPPGGAAYFVPEYMQHAGYEIVPVPVYHPEVTEILGEPVHRSLATVEPPAELVVLFRRSSDVPKHLDEILAARPQVVWMQLGIHHDGVAETLARAGITVVQDKCLKVELARRGR